jgi:hypothetical protein
MCDMPADISKEDLERRIEVFGNGDYGVDLTVTLHGRKFRYVPPEEDTAGAASSVPAAKAPSPPHIAFTMLSVIFLASPKSIMVLSR